MSGTRDDAASGQAVAAARADEALEHLVTELEATVARVQRLVERGSSLRERRRLGTSWLELVPIEARPLIVEELSGVLDRLGEVGARFRRAEAQALAADGLSHQRIARLFGVTRQRVGALLAASAEADRTGPS